MIFLESPWPILVIGLAAEAILAVILARTGRGVLLAAMAAVAVTVGIGLLVEPLVVTDRKLVAHSIDAAAAALEANDLPRLLELLAPDATETRQAAARRDAATPAALRKTLTLDVGSLMGSLVGQTEQAIRSALRIADAMAPCVLFIDEVEKALAGQGSDLSGVTTRLFGTLLTWLADHRTPVYTIGTSNDLSKLPSAFTRAGRFNSTWFFDYPDQEQRAKIWPLYLPLYGLGGDPGHTQEKPDDDRWTGAEIRQCCAEAALQGIPLVEAAQYVIPVAVSGAAENEAMRQQAAGKYLDACRGGTFSLSAQRPAEQRRAIKRAVTGDPSRN